MDDVADVPEAVTLLGIPVPEAVVVVIGGADALDQDLARRDRRGRCRDAGQRSTRDALIALLDEGLAPVSAANHVVTITGGTDAGIMRLAGQVLGRRDLVLVGIAPAARVVVEGRVRRDQSLLESHHQHFVLSAGQNWGSESETLFATAEFISAGGRPRLVVLAAGGEASYYEVRRFLDAGWPVLVLRGLGGVADELADVVSRARARIRFGEVLPLRRSSRRRRRLADRWGDVAALDVDSHKVQESGALLNRRIAWRLSSDVAVKMACASYAAFDAAATRQRNVGRWLRAALGIGSLLLSTVALIQTKLQHSENWLQQLAVFLPVVLALFSTIETNTFPVRYHATYRQAAEASRRALWLYRARGQFAGAAQARQKLVEALHQTNELIGAAAPLLQPERSRARPAFLGAAEDEFAPLNAVAYIRLRIDEQSAYYGRNARVMQRRRNTALTGTALLAAVSSVLASSQNTLALPILVLVASGVTLLQQRARWQERIEGYTAAVIALEDIRNSATGAEEGEDLWRLVLATETVLEQEQQGWLRGMGKTSTFGSQVP